MQLLFSATTLNIRSGMFESRRGLDVYRQSRSSGRFWYKYNILNLRHAKIQCFMVVGCATHLGKGIGIGTVVHTLENALP